MSDVSNEGGELVEIGGASYRLVSQEEVRRYLIQQAELSTGYPAAGRLMVAAVEAVLETLAGGDILFCELEEDDE